MMSFADEGIRSLASDVIRSFEAQRDVDPQKTSGGDRHPKRLSLPSTITLYRTGLVLYSCHYSIAARGGNDDDDIDDDGRVSAIMDAFDVVVSKLPRSYVHDVLLHDMHYSYASMITSFAATSTPSSRPSSPAISGIRSMITPISQRPPESTSRDDIIEATMALCGIYISSPNACRCCCLSLTSEDGRYELELAFASLSWVYEYLLSTSEKGGGNDLQHGGDILHKSILKTLSRILLYGIVNNPGMSDEEDLDDQLSSTMTVIRNIQSLLGEYNCALGDMLDMENEFIDAISSKYHQSKDAPSLPPQLQYLSAMLRSSPRSKASRPCDTVESSPILQIESVGRPMTDNLLDVQIEHVKSVLPALGEGYIEEALKCYNYNVERTMEALLNISDDGSTNDVHPRLLLIPTNLPRKLRDRVGVYRANVNLHRGGSSTKDDGKEHARIQKEHMKYAERRAEDEAFLIENVSRNMFGGLTISDEGAAEDNDRRVSTTRDEYDDDYDDQYDGIGDDGGVAGGIGGLDECLYDVDVHNVHQKYHRGGAKYEQEQWMRYNTVIKEIDAESRFWESNRNSNRDGVANKKQENEIEEHEDGTKYHGPDKGKGGRPIGPDGKYLPIKRGNRKGRGVPVAGSDGNPARDPGRGGRGDGGVRGGGPDTKGEPNANQNKGDVDLSKIQKRRKNDNKSKIGNHHRKDRATKKASGGMIK
ncbi:hypothetical protein ACHAXA_009557 [Cyclostephanos tholiformis]|uniref:CUE domain-containing protein n=1 Tax=Cyclostephanos tholiformis TaxID=382380 RepID=A0ABD3SDY5_9STRA